MNLIQFTDKGLCCPQGNFYIDPWKPVERAVITHAHSDHATWGSQNYLCHHHTKPILQLRLGDNNYQSVEWGETVTMNGVKVSLHPAGHIIESFRNNLWPGYKTGAGIEYALLKQFHPAEEALTAMGIVVWPMTELEADDALASAAYLAAADDRVQKVCIWTPDKDLGQCVRGDRVVQMDNKSGTIRDENAVRKKFGVIPELIPDFLALVGDSADGYPGIAGIGKVSAARLLNEYGPIEAFPKNVLMGQREKALLFKTLATLRTDAALFKNVDPLQWKGPTAAFVEHAAKFGEPRLLERARDLAARP